MTKRISIFILASAALHAAVLGLVRFDPPTPIQAGSLFHVSIQASSSAANRKNTEMVLEPTKVSEKTTPVTKAADAVPETSKQARSKQVIRPEISQQPRQPSPRQETVAVMLESVQPVDTKMSSGATNKVDVSQPDQSLQLSPKTASLLRVDLEQAFALHFRYPRLAIKHGWQGEVRLGLRIEANGHLSQVRVLQGSGYGLLDQAAMKSLNKVEMLPKAIALLNGNSLDLILPVRYRLL